MSLSKAEIDEELINNDIMCTGGVEEQDILQQMNLEEKKNLLKGIKQSQEEFQNDTSSRLNQSTLEYSTSNFPSLTTSGKTTSSNKLKLPRRQPSDSNTSDTDESSDKCISLLGVEGTAVKRFSLPFSFDDGAPSLPMPERPMKPHKNPYFVKKGEMPFAAYKRMLTHHDNWKNAYEAEINRRDSQALGEDIEDPDNKDQKFSPKNHKVEEKENDPYNFLSNSPPCPPKVYNGSKKKDTNLNSDSVLQPSARQLQRKASRDSDCEEVEPILKPDEPKSSEWIHINNRPRNKRNRKQLVNQGKSKIYDSPTDVDLTFDFDSKWDPQSSKWHGSMSPSSSSNNQTRRITNPALAEEEKVQCPICQRNFALSKVEAHAATCEGYSGSDSPMDVEEET